MALSDDLTVSVKITENFLFQEKKILISRTYLMESEGFLVGSRQLLYHLFHRQKNGIFSDCQVSVMTPIQRRPPTTLLAVKS